MQSFCTSLARSLNFNLDRSGGVFVDRYHPHILKTLKEVKNALVYIFQNFAKHSKKPYAFDTYSSFICFLQANKLGLSRVEISPFFQQFKQERSLEKKWENSSFLLKLGF